MNAPLLPLLLCLSFTSATAQEIATLRVDLARPANDILIPAETNLDAITFLPDSALQLTDDRFIPVPFQVAQDVHRTLYWLVEPSTARTAVYHLTKRSSAGHSDSMYATAKDGELTILNGRQHLLQYVYKTMYPPPGIDTAYKRSGFIHPLWSPKGQVLTRIQAPDHYHHYGIWDPWTHFLFKGDTVDCWNLKDRKGTVRFARFASLISGPVFAQYQALQEHVAFRQNGEEVAMNEIQTVRVYKPLDSSTCYLFDITISLNCATPEPVRLLSYRYGGLGWRTTADWNKDNSEVLTSDGKTRKEADGSKARWCIVQGAVGGDYAGAAMLSYPGNYNYPEPLRIWPENSNDRGDMFANFSPTKDTDWLLEPGRDYVLRYRWLVFNGHLDPQKAESVWQYFANPVPVTVIPVPPQPIADTLTPMVFKIPAATSAKSQPMVLGKTRDLSLLRVAVHTLKAGQSFAPSAGDSSDHLLIIKQGNLAVSIDTLLKTLGPGGIGLFAAGKRPSLRNAGTSKAVFYMFSFRSRHTADPNHAKTATVIDWPDMVMKKTEKGESRQIFSCPTAWLGKIDMHATTLDPGQISHPQHIHRAEEIILLRSGHVRMHIANGYKNASAGDLVFLPSGVPHDLENSNTGRAEYFALQWMP
jgi:quercetin dioxygenase-like cupin family protein